jgi:hypothetical protein
MQTQQWTEDQKLVDPQQKHTQSCELRETHYHKQTGKTPYTKRYE